jgi:hypothetical protein
MRRFLPVVLLSFLLPACAPRTAVQSAGADQEITRDLLWKLRSDLRFQDVRVTCVREVVSLEGSVPDEASFREVEKLARDRASQVDNRLRIRPR